MRIRLGNGLLPLNLLVVGLVAIILFSPWNILRIVLGVPFLFFFPGYTLITALFPKRRSIDGIERIALSFGMSIAVVPLIGLILNYTPWGIRLEPILFSIALFILITSIVGWVRNKRLTEHERFSIELRLRMPSWGRGVWDKVLSIVLGIAVLGVLGTVGYVVAEPKLGESFSEFYLQVLGGQVTDYPGHMSIGEEGKVIVGIVNNQYETVNYRVEVRIDGVKNNEVGPVVLANEQKWEQIVTFIPHNAGDNQKVEFFLYRNEEAEPCFNLHLWVDVRK